MSLHLPIESPAQLPATGYVREKHLLKIVPFSAATLWRNVAKGLFPKPVKLSARVTAWRVEEVRAYLDAPATWASQGASA
jgi:predicted DNA-binding transcriptional regulator AlpA